ncbi:helix-turn-helix domain-containing protein [Cecembia lonarensis]|uniref:Exodeoxyribonuclease V, alpha subunit n=1 Tax=Cecembia lonarensis (strain CCUG 58316 / KCTC 22772 / LW9) TaxID=1225176 RepID=K1LXC2_CECL9|nr:helix-turn-helix domain-containing protein [Cecembia lonarensis]EKB48819.1 exodeoxyribonuclease V, alpha subunit [Cecembia lonarensis LW9]
METQVTDRLTLASHFVNSTNSPIFLTGKAGTGKTTFLRNLATMTHKSYVIVAPTGIAALHAKGVTIHSQFLLPLGSFLPSREPEGNFSNSGQIFTQFSLTRRHTLNAARKKVLSAIELLIIDEVSMLRADILDAIDFRLKSVKRNFDVPFGGVQVLFIGDLYQLPPIVKDQEWQILRKFYNSMHFFEAHALKQSGMVYLELDKIFRQKDEAFINILNNLRDNKATEDDIKALNKHFKTEEEIKDLEDTIIITTHNYKADAQNQKELQALKSPSHFFEAKIEKDFPEHLYPLPKTLELKEGAQVMFIKNDSSGNGAYYNGKMAKVKSIEEDEIKVVMTENKLTYTLKRELWENKRYVINESTKELEEDIIGTFEQYPIKLAWAVTVHKSQGLTFDKAIIDVGQAFAPGQVYVALSRLKGLEGLVLRTRIQNDVIYSDHDVANFTQSTKSQEPLHDLLIKHRKTYLEKLVLETFHFLDLMKMTKDFFKETESGFEFEDLEMRVAMPTLLERFEQELDNTQVFQKQLLYLLNLQDEAKLIERLEKGSAYYGELLKEQLKALLIHTAEVERFSQTKKYIESLGQIELQLLKKMSQIKKVSILARAILKEQTIGKLEEIQQEIRSLRIDLVTAAKTLAANNPKFQKNKTGKKKKSEDAPSLKRVKGETYEITYEMSDNGGSIEDIAVQRGLAVSTIKGHLAKGIKEGRISLFTHMDEATFKQIAEIIKKYDADLGAIRQEQPATFDYGTLKMVAAHMGLLENKN